jgi:asparagine synthetase B (glutamine-hydrolysing)
MEKIENYLFIELCDLHDNGNIGGMHNSIYGKNRVLRFKHGVLCPITIKNDEKRAILIVGHPSINNNIDVDRFILDYIESEYKNKADFISCIDGEFLIIDFNKISDEIIVINSRFASPIVFYAVVSERFILSTAYIILFKYLLNNQLAKICPTKIYELLLFRRLFGVDNYDNHSKFLESASKLSWGCSIKIKRYWSPEINRNKYSLSDNARNLIGLLDESIDYKTSDNKRYGIMQSGGLDTRLILSRFKKPPHAFNITYEKNLEYRIAKELVSYKNGEFSWIQAQIGHYKDYFDYGVQTTGGMHQNSGLFYGHRDVIRDKCDVLFSGYGMDYFFQGMYLPSKMYSILGEPIPWYKTLGGFNTGMVEYFIDNISYKTKGFELVDIMSRKQINQMSDSIYNVVESQFEEAKKYSDNQYDIYEHMSLGNLSRHYTYCGQLALMELSEYRTISYTNNILDFYYQLPIEHRFDAKVLRKALLISDKRFYRLPSANHGYSAGLSSFEKSIAHIYKYFPERLGIKEKKRNFERTWLTAEEILRNELLDGVHKLSNSEVLADLNIVDMDKLRKLLKLWNDKQVVGNQSLMMLLTVDSFFKQSM